MKRTIAFVVAIFPSLTLCLGCNNTKNVQDKGGNKLGKLRVTATYFFNQYQGNRPEVAAVFAFPQGWKNKTVPANYFDDLKYSRNMIKSFMKENGGGYIITGGNGQGEMKLASGKYDVVVLMDVKPVMTGGYGWLTQWFNSTFSQAQGIMGRSTKRTVKIESGEISSVSVNLENNVY